MKNSTVVIGLAALAVAGVLGWSLIGLSGCRSRDTRIAEKTLYTGAAPTTAPAVEDWPRWRGPRGDGISREAGLLEKWPDAGPNRLWSADVGVGFASPVAAAGRVYCFSLHNGKESLTCFDAFSGLGVHGQYLFVDHSADVVIVKTSAWPTQDDETRDRETVTALRRIADHFATAR